MKPSYRQLMIPFWFAVALALITVIANVVGYAQTGNEAVGLLPFLCFFPMAFMFACQTQRQAVLYMEVLEKRVQELEGKSR